jgi:ribonuclease Z
LAAISLLTAVYLVSPALADEAGPIRVHLIGTGGPELTPTRQGMSTLIEANQQALIFDVGRGVLQNIYLSRIDPRSVTKIFLTHLHSDHIEGLPSIWMTPWFMFARKPSLEIWGPQGTQQMVDGMRTMYGTTLSIAPTRFSNANTSTSLSTRLPRESSMTRAG